MECKRLIFGETVATISFFFVLFVSYCDWRFFKSVFKLLLVCFIFVFNVLILVVSVFGVNVCFFLINLVCFLLYKSMFSASYDGSRFSFVYVWSVLKLWLFWYVLLVVDVVLVKYLSVG